MNKKFLLILLMIFIVGAGITSYLWYQSNLAKQNQFEETAVKNVVENFGKVLKNVSLLAPKETVTQGIEQNYKDFVASDLLAKWETDPSEAPGRLTSSPWPDRIDIMAINKINADSYEVSGNVVEMTSQEVVDGGIAGRYPVMVKVEKINNKWLITSFEGYPKTQSANSIEYQNTQYGFSFSLPESWTGYSIVTDKWEGYTIGPKGDILVEQGLLISIRHPQWTSKNPRQDIPIMVFTLIQWDSLLRDKFHIGAAPINPTLLSFNANYVFALPARYNYAFRTGYEEVEKILESNPLQSLPSWNTISDEGKLLLCGGIPNGSTQNITETTRLFINLPKDVYPDEEHNLQFKTMNGNATAGWISNAGPYGEAFESTPDCWSYYYEFDGSGEVNLTVKAATKSASDYFVRFIVSSSQ
jgi:hypothetical protein